MFLFGVNRMMKDIQRAMMKQQTIRIIYLGGQGQTTMRMIRPLELTESHLKAYCYSRRAPRVFAVDRILAVAVVEKPHVG
jgi:predicted DNA-binding transcriptional regulator YafY